MKKLIVLLAITSLFTGCKSKNKSINQPSKQIDVWCIFIVNGTQKTFHKCVSTENNELQNESIKLTDAGIDHEKIKKASCAECQ